MLGGRGRAGLAHWVLDEVLGWDFSQSPLIKKVWDILKCHHRG